MKKLITAVIVTSAVLTSGSAALAHTGVGTQPTPSPGEVWPYVPGDRADSTTVAYQVDPIVQSYDLLIYSYVASEEGTLFEKDAGSDGSVDWNPALEGDVLNGKFASAVRFYACVFPDGEVLEATDIPAEWCANVYVTHEYETARVTRTKRGSAYADKKGDCRTTEWAVAVEIRCNMSSTLALRYRFRKPALDTNQSFRRQPSVSWDGRIRREGFGTSLERTRRGAMFVARELFWGKVSSVSKTWTVRTEH